MDQGELVLNRTKGYVDAARAYKILIDGQEAGRIKQGREVRLPVSPGQHQLQVKVDWAVSPPEVFDVGAGQAVRFTCRPNAKPWSVLYYGLFARKKYLTLERLR